MSSEFLMLAKVLKKQDVRGWYCSEKLDGTRAFWDGGVSKGMMASDVPWANCVKDYRLKEPPVATGLWSRTGKVLDCPDWWAVRMPEFCVDGELFMGNGSFQTLRKTVAGSDWKGVRYMAFGCPNDSIFADRWVKVRNDYKYKIEPGLGAVLGGPDWGLYREYARLRIGGENEVFKIVEQESVPWTHSKDWIKVRLDRVLDNGGEGLMFRTGSWEATRSNCLLKYKPFLDNEGEIVGFTEGKGKYVGLVGALIVKSMGKQFKLSGMTDNERQPGHFLIGDTVTYRYRELSDDGVPKEARFWRQ